MPNYCPIMVLFCDTIVGMVPLFPRSARVAKTKIGSISVKSLETVGTLPLIQCTLGIGSSACIKWKCCLVTSALSNWLGSYCFLSINNRTRFKRLLATQLYRSISNIASFNFLFPRVHWHWTWCVCDGVINPCHLPTPPSGHNMASTAFVLGNVQVWRHQEVPPTGLGKYDTWWCQCWDRGGWSSKIWHDDGILWQCFTETS